LNRLVTPQGIARFFEGLANWRRDAATFRRSMSRYLNDFEGGGEVSVQVLTITPDGSFLTLQVCSAISTGEASAGAAPGGAVAALARAAGHTAGPKCCRRGPIHQQTLYGRPRFPC